MACCAWKPRMLSAISELAPSSRRARASSAAFRARIAASWLGSSSGDDTAVSEGFVHQRAGNRSPALGVIGTDHDQVDWNAHRAQRFTQSHELGAPTL